MPTVHAEVEATYELDDAVEVPSLVELLGAARAAGDVPADGDGPWAEGETGDHRLSATYYDTPDLRLAAAGLTLRRRTGGEDAGWHLKVPMVDGSRSEVRLPVTDGSAGVPADLVTMTYARTGGAGLVPVAQVDTHRTVRHLVDATGRVLLEVADDRVTARRLVPPSDADGHARRDGDAAGTDGDAPETEAGTDGPDAPTTWREVEVEVVDGPRGLLTAVDPLLREHGLRPAATASKLARTLGADAVDRARARHSAGAGSAAAGDWTSATPAADVVLARIGVQVEQIRAQDLPVRLDAPGAVHAMRVATRRLRSALRTFGPLLRGSATRPVARELKWLAGVLGDARDAEVLRARVAAAVEAESDYLAAPQTVSADVRTGLDDAYTTAHGALVGQLDGDRYRALLAALAELVDDPPLKKRAARPGRKVLPALVAAADRELRTAMRAARHADDPAGRETLLHEARKAAKRARYAAEAVAGVVGADATRYAAAMEAVQEAAGDHLDAIATRDRVRELAERTTLPATAFTLGRLHAREDARVEESRTEVDDAWSAARAKGLRRWLR